MVLPISAAVAAVALLAYSRRASAAPRSARGPLRALSDAERLRLSKLQPQVLRLVLALRARLNEMGLDFFVGTTMRSDAEQREQEAAGRSANPTPYWHGSGRAVDLYMIDRRTGKPDEKARDRAAYEAMHREAERLGFRVLGFRELRTRSGKTFRDPYHIELRDGFDPDAALARYRRGVDRSADGRVYA